MGEATIKPKPLENAPVKSSHARDEFLTLFLREAGERDRKFVKERRWRLGNTSHDAGLCLLGAGASIVIIDLQTGSKHDFRIWNNPNPAIARVYLPLYLSFGLSFCAWFITTSFNPSLTRYARVDTRGSVADRAQREHAKMDALATYSWYFDLVMDIPLLIIFPAYLFFLHAISNYALLIGFTFPCYIGRVGTFMCLLYYLIISSDDTVSYSRPFRTPLSLLLSLIHFGSNPKKYLERTGEWFRPISSQKKTRPRQKSGGLHVPNEEKVGNQAMQSMADHPLPLLNKEIDWDLHVLDAKAIVWTAGRVYSTDEGPTLVLLRFVPEVIWHAGIQTTPAVYVSQSLLPCFRRSSSGHYVVVPKLRDQAYLGAMALLHLVIQRKCINDTAVFDSISSWLPIVGSEHYKGDSDLEATLGMVDCVFGKPKPIHWHNFTFTVPHHAWMARILLYRAWDTLTKGEPLPDNIEAFALCSLRLEDPPPTIVADCLLIVGLVLGITFPADGLSVVDKSHEINPQINRIYGKLAETFREPTFTPEDISHAVTIVETITPLAKNDAAQKSYDLFRAVMRAPISPAYSQQQKWHVSRLAMRSAYKWDRLLPRVEDPHYILTFLTHHFQSATGGGRDQDEPIETALSALAHASSPTTIEALKHFNPTESFVCGICYAFRDDRPLQLRRAALFFLPLIEDWLFEAPDSTLWDNQLSRLCVDWASTVDSIEHTPGAQKAILVVLFGMTTSSRWHHRIVPEKWKLLEYFASVPDDSRFFRKCVDNPGFIRGMKYKTPAALVFWLAILWLRYKELTPQVREQLEEVTKERVQDGRMDLCWYLSVMDSELRKAEDALRRHNIRSIAGIALRKKIDNLRQARVSFVTLTGCQF